MRARIVLAFLFCAALLASDAERVQPRFAEGNQLVRPEGYREWVFLGSSLGMSYDEGAYKKPPEFHNVYLQPEAFGAFRSTGKFPDKTLLVLELMTAAGQASINKRGQFEDRLIGVEAAVKDEKRFPEKWAYFSFIGPRGEALAQAKPFPKEACWSCHNRRADVDNVFVQFYPALRELKPKSGSH